MNNIGILKVQAMLENLSARLAVLEDVFSNMQHMSRELQEVKSWNNFARC
jgi:hypothetical protein